MVEGEGVHAVGEFLIVDDGREAFIRRFAISR